MTMPPQKRPMGWLVLPCRVILGGLFILAAYMKLKDPQAFAFAVAAFKVIPKSSEHLTLLATFVVPWTELIAGVFLVLGLWARGAAVVISLMLVAFIGGIASVLIRGLDASCTCFGELDWPCPKELGMCQIIRDVIMLAMGGVVVLWGPGPLAIDRESSR